VLNEAVHQKMVVVLTMPGFAARPFPMA